MSPYRINARREPLDHSWRGMAVAAALGLVGAAMVVTGLACGAAPTPAQGAELGAWGTADGFCTARATTRAQDDACRDMLRKLFCADGGDLNSGCAHVRMSDGGAP